MSLLCKVVAVKAEDQTIKKTKYIKVLTLFWPCNQVVAEFYNIWLEICKFLRSLAPVKLNRR